MLLGRYSLVGGKYLLFSISTSFIVGVDIEPSVTDDDFKSSSVDTLTSTSVSLVTSSLPKSKFDSVVVVVVAVFLGNALSWKGFKKLKLLPKLRAICEKNCPMLN